MSDPSGDPPSPSSHHPADGPEAAPRGLPTPVTPAPRANPPSVFNPKEGAAAPGAPAGFNDLMAWMQSFSGGGAGMPGPVDAPTSQRAQLPKEQKKFHKYDPDAVRPDRKSTVPGPYSEESAPIGVAPASRGELLPADAALDRAPVIRKRRPKAPGETVRRSYKFLLPLLGIPALVGGGFWLGRATVPKIVPSVVAPTARETPDWGDRGNRVAALVDQAMTAENKGDLRQATDLLQQVQAERPRVLGTTFQLAMLAYASGDYARALALLNESVEAGEEVAASYNLRGTLNNRVSGVNRGLTDLEAATRLDPYTARNFYFLGEALRRSGKPQAALVRLRQATDRLREPTLAGLYQLKVRLTQIELGQEGEFAEQLAREIQRTPPPIDWLFTAAAVEMHQGRFDAAAGYLDKAATVVDQQTMNVRLRDYFFFGFANEKLLSRFYDSLRQTNAALAATAAKANATKLPEGAPALKLPDTAPPAADLSLPGVPAAPLQP